MTRDHRYNQIVDGLNGRLDPQLFERCANDLIQRDFSTLVPVTGGSDSGFDGAVARASGEPAPVIVTTGKDPVRNLRKNLKQIHASGTPTREAVFGTSRPLTPQARQKLLETARQLGFTLRQVYEQEAFAARLYRHPTWCKLLLNVDGDALALSAVGRGYRDFGTRDPIGRDQELASLRSQKADALLVGQPGSGKTLLLDSLVESHGALFVNSQDQDAIADGVREQQPAVLLVDDAHTQLQLVQTLLWLRQSMGASFRIIASCWPGDADQLAAELRTGRDAVLELKPLRRKPIAEIIRKVEPRLADWVVGIIADQAEGRPGLAATLAHLCSLQKHEAVVKGDALLRMVSESVRRLVGDDAVNYLACFSLGGNDGVATLAVAKALNRTEIGLQREIAQLAAAGLVHECHRGVLAVRPPALRESLVKAVFLESICPADSVYESIKESVSSRALLRTLIGSARLGGQRADHEIRSLLAQTNDADLWEAYAWLGPEASRWTLSSGPRRISSMAHPLLYHTPEETLPRLFDEAALDDGAPASGRDQWIPEISNWVAAGQPGRPDALQRRVATIAALERWPGRTAQPAICIEALTAAFSVIFTEHRSDPVLRNSVGIRAGVLLSREIKELVTIWPSVFALLVECQPARWRAILSLCENWVYPHGPLGSSPTPTARTIIRRQARKMIRDLLTLPDPGNGVRSALKSYARHVRLRIRIDVDPEYATVYPDWDRAAEWKRERDLAEKRALELAQRWAADDPVAIIERLTRFEREHVAAGRGLWDCGPLILTEIAERCSNSREWYTALVRFSARAQLVAPFLIRTYSSLDRAGQESLLLDALESGATRPAAYPVALGHPRPSEELLQGIAQHAPEFVVGVSIVCERPAVDDAVLARLVDHENDEVAVAAALAVWDREPRGHVPESLRFAWKRALLRADAERRTAYSPSLDEILRSDASLAFEWISRQLSKTLVAPEADRVASLIASLPKQRRRELVCRLPEYCPDELVCAIVSGDVEIYDVLIQLPPPSWHWERVLRGPPGEAWGSFAAVALSRGKSPKDVARAAFTGIRAWCGSEAEMWRSWLPGFQRLREDQDFRIAGAARIALEWLEHDIRSAEQREFLEEVRGDG